MKGKSYIGISFIILVFGIIVIPRIVDRISNGSTNDFNRMNRATQVESSKDLLKSIGKAPSFSLTDQNGSLLNSSDLKGKVYVVEFFFSTCPSICVQMNENMKIVSNKFKDSEDFHIVSITINPEYDTPEVLLQHAKDLGISNVNWHFLTGDRTTIFDLSNKGFNLYAGINESIDGGFEHSGLFALIDKEGNIRSRVDDFGNPIVYYDGLEEAGISALIQDAQVLLNE